MRLIRSTYEVVTEESAANGDWADRGWIDEQGEECLSPSDAIRLLKSVGAMYASSSHFHPGVWYYTEASQDYHTGEYRTESYHLHGFTPRAERMVWDAITERLGDE
jgi:hypothetical protein